MHRKTNYLSAMSMPVWILVASAPGAQTAADALPPQFTACADEVDVMRRLSCYDREMALLRASPAPKPAATEPAPKPAAAEPVIPEPGTAAVVAEAANDAEPVTAETETQTTAGVAAAVTSSVPSIAENFGEKDNGPVQIQARVASIQKRPYGELIILLDNGQVWEQKHRDTRFRLEVGEVVTVTKGLISGYRLSGASNNSIQVRRRK